MANDPTPANTLPSAGADAPPLTDIAAPTAQPTMKVLSDGQNYVSVPPGLSVDDEQKLMNAGEFELGKMYGNRAAKQGGPVTVGDKIYSSAGNSFPNTDDGSTAAHIDQYTRGSGVPVDALGRVVVNALPHVGSTSFAAQGVNAVKHGVAPEMGQQYDLPVSSQVIRDTMGIKDMPADAPWYQRYGEPIATGLLSALFRNPAGVGGSVGQVLKEVGKQGAYSVGGEQLGKAGQYVGGSRWGEALGLLGNYAGGGGIPAGKAVQYGLGRIFAKSADPASPAVAGQPDVSEMRSRLGATSASDIYGAAQELDPNFIPSYGTLANPTGQRFGAWLAGKPLTGTVLEDADAATRSFLQDAKNRAAIGLAGGPMPAEVGPESIGTQFIHGARESMPMIAQAEQARWDPINRATRGQDVNLAPVVGAANEATAGNQMPGPLAESTQAAVEPIRQAAPGGPGYDVSARGAVPPLPAGNAQQGGTLNVPWEFAQRFKTDLGGQLPQGTISAPQDITASLKGITTDAMREAATRAGVGPDYNAAIARTAQISPFREQLEAIGGAPVGPQTAPTGFKPGMGEQEAAGTLSRNLRSPSNLEPFTNPSLFSPDYWRRIAGQDVSTYGQTPAGDFRPEQFTTDFYKRSPEVRAQLGTDPTTGRELPQFHQLENIATVGGNYVPPTSRFGLSRALAAGQTLDQVNEAAAQAGKRVFGEWGGRIGGITGVNLALSHALGSPFTRKVMGGAPVAGDVVDQVMRNMPRIGALSTQNYSGLERGSPAAPYTNNPQIPQWLTNAIYNQPRGTPGLPQPGVAVSP